MTVNFVIPGSLSGIKFFFYSIGILFLNFLVKLLVSVPTIITFQYFQEILYYVYLAVWSFYLVILFLVIPTCVLFFISDLFSLSLPKV